MKSLPLRTKFFNLLEKNFNGKQSPLIVLVAHMLSTKTWYRKLGQVVVQPGDHEEVSLQSYIFFHGTPRTDCLMVFPALLLFDFNDFLS